jgi:hypothetical protein
MTWRNQPYHPVASAILISFMLFIVAALGRSATSDIVEPSMSDAERERTRAIIISGIDEGLKEHVKHMFEVWMKDDSEQPKRAVTGMHIGRRAHRHAMAQALGWNPPTCEEKKP